MKDQRIAAYADLLVNYSMRVKKGDKVRIQGSLLAAPLIEELTRYVLRAGGFPYVLANWETLHRIRLTEASDEQLTTITDVEETLLTKFDCVVYIRAPENTQSLTSVDPRRSALAAKAREPYQRHLINNVRWVVCNYPTQALAQEAAMSLEEYADLLFGACLINWEETRAFMSRVKAAFDAADTVRITGPGTDLTFSLRGRFGVICAGENNMPDGEVFYAPVEDSTEGYITFEWPSIHESREVAGIRLEFSGGRVVKASAEKGEDYLLKILETDPGARVLGEFGIGCNFGITSYTKNTLFDEKIGGTIHLALGRSYEESGGTNKSAIHWDMVKDLRRGGRIELDGKVIQENGQFVGI